MKTVDLEISTERAVKAKNSFSFTLFSHAPLIVTPKVLKNIVNPSGNLKKVVRGTKKL
jgi:hypothetical protein